MNKSNKKTALVIGSNRGIGLGLTEQLLDQGYHVIATCRQPEQAELLHAARMRSNDLEIYQLDVTNDEQIDHLLDEIGERAIDRLILNAGIHDKRQDNESRVDRDNLHRLFETNSVSPLKLASKLWPAVQKSEEKLIVAMSSKMGSIADNRSGGSYAYRASKTALNAFMYSFALDIKSYGIHLLIFHPGWVKTDMGGPNALIDVDTSVSGMLAIMAEAKRYSTGSFLSYDGHEIDW